MTYLERIMFLNEKDFSVIKISETHNFAEIAIDHVAASLSDVGVKYIYVRGPYLIVDHYPEMITITMSDCGGAIFIEANLDVTNPQCHSDRFIEDAFSLTTKDEWCGASSYVHEGGHVISLEMVVPCHHDGLLSFSKSWEKFEGKLKTFKAEASKIGLELVSDDDTDPVAVNA